MIDSHDLDPTASELRPTALASGRRGIRMRFRWAILALAAIASCSNGANGPKTAGVPGPDSASTRDSASDGDHWREDLRRVDTLTIETADGAWHLIADRMAPQSIDIQQGGAKITVLGDIPVGAHLSVLGGGACVVVGGTVEQDATVRVFGGGATIIVSTRNAISASRVAAHGGAARVIAKPIDPLQPFDGCDDFRMPQKAGRSAGARGGDRWMSVMDSIRGSVAP